MPIKAMMSSIFILLAILFLVSLFVFKGSMNALISKKMKDQAGETVQKNMAMYVDSAYNFKNNMAGYQITFLEFGATGCSSCRMMEKVMEEVRSKYPSEIREGSIQAYRFFFI
ncbi:MAG: thioredoxin family protein [Bacteroidetes bacterium]|nr:thioredoxin family protein [Bacteroidota bacterium]